MRSATCVAVLCLVTGIAFLATSAPAAAPPRLITGELSKSGYTVIALADDGKATSVRVERHKFRLRPPAKRVTLHLRAPNGRYAGPIVIGTEKRGKIAILGVRAGARLGRIKVRRGYAKVVKRPRKRWVDEKRAARATRGVPLGTGRFGLVRSKPPRQPVRGDLDLDGVADSLDVDDDGDRVLDDYDRSTRTRASQTAHATGTPGGTFPDGNRIHVATQIIVAGQQSVNVNGGSSDAQIAAIQQGSGVLNVTWIGIDPDSGELDCGALVYCSAGGTGRLQTSDPVPRAEARPFPECCDLDGDGFGSLTQWTPPPGIPKLVDSMHLWHGATTDQIRAGDVLIVRATINGEPSQFATSVGYVFSTFSVPASYSDGQGNAGTFSYSGSQQGGPPIVKHDPGGQLVLTFALWRPQRPRIEGEPGGGKWMDVGNLAYGVSAHTPGDQAPVGPCPQSSLSTADPNLTPLSSSPLSGPFPNAGGFQDHSGDQPSSPVNTFTYTLNATRCLASQGSSINPGGSIDVLFWAFATDANGSVSFALAGTNFLVQQ